jgi:AGZA family xanthine/uracil permease-like MFS transporter
VGFFMAWIIRDIDFGSVEDGLPALLTVTVMPFSFSITNGIGAGFVLYTFLQMVSGKAGRVHWMMYLVSAAFVLYFGLNFLHSTFGI